MAARAGTPLDVRECLQQALARTPAQFADDLRRDFDRMSAVIRAANIRL